MVNRNEGWVEKIANVKDSFYYPITVEVVWQPRDRILLKDRDDPDYGVPTKRAVVRPLGKCQEEMRERCPTGQRPFMRPMANDRPEFLRDGLRRKSSATSRALTRDGLLHRGVNRLHPRRYSRIRHRACCGEGLNVCNARQRAPVEAGRIDSFLLLRKWGASRNYLRSYSRLALSFTSLIGQRQAKRHLASPTCCCF